MDKRNSWAPGSRKRKEPAFWLSVLTKLQNRGVKDIFIACVDGLTGLPEAIEAVFPREPGAIVYGTSDAQLAALRLV